jgi:hypothetical protein
VTSEDARVTRMRIEQDRVTRREQADKKKEFHEHIKDLGFES